MTLTYNRSREPQGYIIEGDKPHLENEDLNKQQEAIQVREINSGSARWIPRRVAGFLWWITISNLCYAYICLNFENLYSQVNCKYTHTYVYLYISGCVHDLRRNYQLYSVACNFFFFFKDTICGNTAHDLKCFGLWNGHPERHFWGGAGPRSEERGWPLEPASPAST